MTDKHLLKQKIIACLNRFAKSKTFDEIKESAIPSYIHRNPIVRQIFWNRVFAILNQISRLAPKSILDFGCGSSIITALIDPKIDRFVTDVFYEPFDFMQQCLANLQGVKKIYQSNLISMESQFDIILAADVLEHLSDDHIKNQLVLFHKWLKSNGHLIISGPTENLIYKIGRKIAGYKGDYHKTNVKIVNIIVSGSKLFQLENKIRYPIPYIFEGFWILTYKKI